MIQNVFGNPVTRTTVRNLKEFQNEPVIFPRDMARVALMLKNSQQKDHEKALSCVETMRKKFDRDGTGSMRGWIYNATGGAINLVDSYNWNGRLVLNPYPVRIENGQWGMFLHEQCSYGISSGAVVYDGFNYDGEPCCWCLAWDTSNKNKVYSEVRDGESYQQADLKNIRKSLLEKSSPIHRTVHEGFFSIISVSHGSEATFEALLTLNGV